MATARNIRIGRLGEQAAARYLEGRGYRVLDRNWRSPDPEERGELDLVLRHRRDLVVCEVKTRTGGALAHPVEAVTEQKAARLRRLAVLWVRARREDARRRAGPLLAPRPALATPARIRIDVVAVRLGPQEPFPLLSIEHLRGVA
jgi:putative endonuclease